MATTQAELKLTIEKLRIQLAEAEIKNRKLRVQIKEDSKTQSDLYRLEHHVNNQNIQIRQLEQVNRDLSRAWVNKLIACSLGDLPHITFDNKNYIMVDQLSFERIRKFLFYYLTLADEKLVHLCDADKNYLAHLKAQLQSDEDFLQQKDMTHDQAS